MARDEQMDKEIKYANIERLDEAQMLELKNLLLAIKNHFVAYYDEAFEADTAPVDAFVFWEVTLIQEDLAEMMQRLEDIKNMAPWHAELSGKSPHND